MFILYQAPLVGRAGAEPHASPRGYAAVDCGTLAPPLYIFYTPWGGHTSVTDPWAGYAEGRGAMGASGAANPNSG
jgi:hypothetical protein